MTRKSNNQYRHGYLYNGYDYENQAWVVNGRYIRCGHPETMDCRCYGREHEGGFVNPMEWPEIGSNEEIEMAEEYSY